MDGGGCRGDTAAYPWLHRTKSHLWTYHSFLWLFLHSYPHTKRPLWLLSTMTKTGAITHIQQRTHWCRRKLGYLDGFLKKLLLRQELTPQAGIESFSGDKEKMGQRRDLTDGDVIPPIWSKLRPLQQLHRLARTWAEAWSNLGRLDPIWFSHVSEVVS